MMNVALYATKRPAARLDPRLVCRDARNLRRGFCRECGETFCPAFISVSGRVLCDYCGCPPGRHELLAESWSSDEGVGPSSEFEESESGDEMEEDESR